MPRQTTEPAAPAAIYLVRGGRLVAARRATTSPHARLEALLAGPSAAERSAGIDSAIPSSSGAMALTVDGRVALVHIPAEFARLDGDQQVLAVAQLVYTLIDESGVVTGVRLLRGGREIPAPTGTGQLVSRPLTRADFAVVAPG